MSFFACNAQQSVPFDKTKIDTASELNFAFSDKRGIELANGIIVLVEQNMKVLTACKNGVRKWKANIIAKCGEPYVGEPEIRFIKIDGDKINCCFW